MNDHVTTEVEEIKWSVDMILEIVSTPPTHIFLYLPPPIPHRHCLFILEHQVCTSPKSETIFLISQGNH